jgi:hypothetical protein
MRDLTYDIGTSTTWRFSAQRGAARTPLAS